MNALRRREGYPSNCTHDPGSEDPIALGAFSRGEAGPQDSIQRGRLPADRALSLVSSLRGILVVRYLGPEDYGVLSYARGFVALFVPWLVSTPRYRRAELAKGINPAQVLGTAFALQLSPS